MSQAAELILVLNCGSSSIKFALFAGAADPVSRTPEWSGQIRGIGGAAPEYLETGKAPAIIPLDSDHSSHSALRHVLGAIAARMGASRVVAIGHRVVHGGSKYSGPVRIDAGVLADLRR